MQIPGPSSSRRKQGGLGLGLVVLVMVVMVMMLNSYRTAFKASRKAPREQSLPCAKNISPKVIGLFLSYCTNLSFSRP